MTKPPPLIATKDLSPGAILPSTSHNAHSHKVVNEDTRPKPCRPRKRGSTNRPAPMLAEGSTEKSHDENGDDANAWSWLLKVEESYQETIANATMELENRIYAENSGPESDEEEDKRKYKYYYRGPEPEEPARFTIFSSEPWFAAGYTDYRDSYSSSESDKGDEDTTYNADSDSETGDETTIPIGSICEACRKEGCECTNSILMGLASASLSEEMGDVHSPGDK